MRRYNDTAVPGSNASKLAHIEILIIVVLQHRHVAHIGPSISSTLTILASKGENHLLALFVTLIENSAIIAREFIGTKVTCNNLLTQSLTFFIVFLADKNRSVEQQTSLQHTVHGLVYSCTGRVITGFLRKRSQTVVKFFHDEVVDLLTAGVPVRICRSWDIGTGRYIKRKSSTPHFKHIVVSPRTKSMSLCHIRIHLGISDTQSRTAHTCQVGNNVIGKSYHRPAVGPGILDDFRL